MGIAPFLRDFNREWNAMKKRPDTALSPRANVLLKPPRTEVWRSQV